MSRRTDRINGVLRHEISELLRREIKDPRLTPLTSVIQVDVSVDLRHARVYVSVMGTLEERKGAIEGLVSAEGYLRRGLKDRLSLRYIPSLRFILDDSMEQADHILKLLNRLSPEKVEPYE